MLRQQGQLVFVKLTETLSRCVSLKSSGMYLFLSVIHLRSSTPHGTRSSLFEKRSEERRKMSTVLIEVYVIPRVACATASTYSRPQMGMVPKGREAIVATQKWMSRSVPARSVVVVTELVMATPLTLATVLPDGKGGTVASAIVQLVRHGSDFPVPTTQRTWHSSHPSAVPRECATDLLGSVSAVLCSKVQHVSGYAVQTTPLDSLPHARVMGSVSPWLSSL
mmetsp:Transcript_21379/g.25276  ORF Transcript_21379/g.25276 Transcript_21379/m.25276 type:complete len:222 (+) Transcript_21379:706-1371(+)